MRIQVGIWAAVSAMLLTSAPMTASAVPGENQGRGEERRSEHALARDARRQTDADEDSGAEHRAEPEERGPEEPDLPP